MKYVVARDVAAFMEWRRRLEVPATEAVLVRTVAQARAIALTDDDEVVDLGGSAAVSIALQVR